MTSPTYNGRTTTQFTEEEDAIIRTYAAAGISATRCAHRLNRTKNSIIGRAHRINARFHAIGGGPHKPIPTQHPNPVRLGLHKPWTDQNMSATLPIHHGRRLDDDK